MEFSLTELSVALLLAFIITVYIESYIDKRRAVKRPRKEKLKHQKCGEELVSIIPTNRPVVGCTKCKPARRKIITRSKYTKRFI